MFACKKSTTGGGGGGGGDDDQGMPDAPGNTGSGGDTTFSLQWGPVSVPANTEDTQCVTLPLKNAAAVKVHEIHDTLTLGSHHMIVYRDNDGSATEQDTPIDCQPFTGALNTSGLIEPLAISQKLDDDIVLPDTVAYSFNANQMIKIELHYINTSDSTENIQGNVVFTTADPSTVMNEAGLLFTGSPDVDVLANTTTTLHEFFAVPPEIDLSQSHIFAITGHEHHLGTGVEVGWGTGSAGPFKVVYNHPDPNFSWSDPATDEQTPDFAVPAGGGFDFTCTWNNQTANPVKFGESANDEMCFFWAYYWPAPSSEVCVHTDQSNPFNVHDLCCPSSNALCAYLPAILGGG
ncbi:MAG TPA: hypothetical protein VH143_01550 [Kofleriaceae bacterium]|nr:hypothetical protein [Kofleriaceae bacterium]